MALISRIRRNSWLLVIVIGLALAAFILMDMTAGGGRASAGDFTLGTVNGEAIDYKEFQNTEQVLYTGGGNTYSNRNYLWNFFVERTLVGQYAEKLGLGVSKDELMELQFGNRLSPIITQRFVNPNTGQIDRASLNNMRTLIESDQLDPNQRAFWRVQEKEIVSNRLQDKLNAAVSKGLYTPSWLADVRNSEQKATINFDYVKIPYTSVEDTEVEYTDEDLQNYMKANLETYRQDEETRIAEYVTFDVFPTKEDSINIFNRLEDLKTRLEESEDDSLFVINNNGIYNLNYLKASEVSPVLQDVILDLPVGSTYGPFIDNGQYQIINILDNKVLPDSVRSRHILRQVQTQEEFIVANALIDSLMEVIDNGSTTFEQAAMQFGSDGTRTRGGDLGYAAPGFMVKPFNDLIFYQAEEGELRKVITQFGIHLVEVTDKKFENRDRGVQYSMLFENIIPSQETQTTEYDRVFDIISENNSLEKLRAALPNMEKELLVSPAVAKNDFGFPEISSSPTAREIVRWLFTPGIKTGETSPDVHVYKDPNLYYNSKLLLVGLSEIASGDLPSVSSIRARIEPLVINEKKGEFLLSQIGDKDMDAAAAAYEVEVQQASDIGLASGFIPGIGNEPAILGTAFTMENGDVAGPLAGKDGVYFIKLTSKNEAPPISDLAASKRIYSSISKNQVNVKLWEAVRAGKEIEDNRYTYY